MRKFSDFIIENLKKDIANLIVESNLDPWDFIFDFYKEDKHLIYKLKENKKIIEEGFFGNIGRAAGRIGSTMGGWLGQTARSGYKTAQAAAAAGRDAISGPDARFRNAIEAMNALSKELSNNQMIQQSAASDSRYKEIIQNLENIKNDLQKQQPVVKQLMTMKTDPGQQTPATNRFDPGPAPEPYKYKRDGD